MEWTIIWTYIHVDCITPHAVACLMREVDHNHYVIH